jgi:hypothetical protein
MRTARPLDGSGNILAYRRSLDGRRIVVALNFADAEGEVAPPGAGRIRLSTQLDRQDGRVDGSVRRRAHEKQRPAAQGELTVSTRSICISFAAVLVASCAASRMPETSFGEPQALERAVMRYYESHASEENLTCLRPYMEGVTQVNVLEERPERLVVDVRYLYRDRSKDDGGNGIGRDCSGYHERRFTLGKSPAGIEVLDMTGPQRTARRA